MKSGQVVINSPQEISEAIKSFAPSINDVYQPESESIIESKDKECAEKIKNALNLHKLERKVNANGKLYISFFKIADNGEPFHVQWYVGENDIT